MPLLLLAPLPLLLASCTSDDTTAERQSATSDEVLALCDQVQHLQDLQDLQDLVVDAANAMSTAEVRAEPAELVVGLEARRGRVVGDAEVEAS